MTLVSCDQLRGLTARVHRASTQSWLVRPWWLWGGGYFAEEVVGAINRCNYNQRNAELNALAGAPGGRAWGLNHASPVEGGCRQ